ncbi:MAG: transporter [Clostridia bacterium]|nr:transporter [Clostridia bacterium]
MNIVLRELRANLKSIIIWSLCMIFLIYVGMVKYSGFAAAGEGVNELMAQMPEVLKNMLGMNEMDLTSVSGFYAIFYLYFMLIAGVHAVMLGAVIISKEERDKTADFLFVKPILRSRAVTAKLAAAFINIVVLNLVTLVSSIIFVGMFNEGEPINDQIVRLMLALFILQIIFLTLGASIAAIARNTKKAASVATTVLLTAFILSIAIDLNDKIDYLTFLTPFKYFNAGKVMREGSYEPVYLLLSAAIAAACTAVTYVVYKRRDLHV